MEEDRPSKRRRVGGPTFEEQQAEAGAGTSEHEPIEHLLYIRWFGGQGQTKLNKLPLRQIDTLEALEDLPKELVESHYPEQSSLPDYFTNTAYVRFTPEVDCLALPGKLCAQQPHFWVQGKMQAQVATCHAALRAWDEHNSPA